MLEYEDVKNDTLSRSRVIFNTKRDLKSRTCSMAHTHTFIPSFEILLVGVSVNQAPYWQFNYDAPGQTEFFSPEPFRVLLSDITISLSVYVTQCVQQLSV